MVDLIEKLCDEVETVNGFCYLRDRLNASGGCEVAVTARVRIGWARFRECGELLLGSKVMVSGWEGELLKSKIGSCGVCRRRVMANSVLCTKCGNWVYVRCAINKESYR